MENIPNQDECWLVSPNMDQKTRGGECREQAELSHTYSMSINMKDCGYCDTAPCSSCDKGCHCTKCNTSFYDECLLVASYPRMGCYEVLSSLSDGSLHFVHQKSMNWRPEEWVCYAGPFETLWQVQLCHASLYDNTNGLNTFLYKLVFLLWLVEWHRRLETGSHSGSAVATSFTGKTSPSFKARDLTDSLTHYFVARCKNSSYLPTILLVTSPQVTFICRECLRHHYHGHYHFMGERYSSYHSNSNCNCHARPSWHPTPSCCCHMDVRIHSTHDIVMIWTWSLNSFHMEHFNYHKS